MVCAKHVCRTVVLLLLASLVAAGFAGAQEKVLLMATTTSTEDTGLLNVLAPEFKKASGIDLRWTATGTGKALKLGESCDVDVLMVHAPDAEKKFVADGFGINRKEIMYNDFVIIGPAADPAGVRGKSVKDALLAIQAKKANFVSRGDKSGTHMMELGLWKVSGAAVPEKEAWYDRRREERLHFDRPRHLHQVRKQHEGQPPPENPGGRRPDASQPIQRDRREPGQVPEGPSRTRDEVQQLDRRP
jgi:ABC-type tungstate transport system permease subunit